MHKWPNNVILCLSSTRIVALLSLQNLTSSFLQLSDLKLQEMTTMAKQVKCNRDWQNKFKKK